MLVALLAVALTSSTDTSRIVRRFETPTVVTSPVTGVRSHLAADSIVVEKRKHTLTLFSWGHPVRTYHVALGTNPIGDKVRQGDGRTPEGVFHIDGHNPDSKYYKSLHISYPDAAHLRAAEARGFSAGGDIMIHGLPDRFASVGAAHRDYDWTEGCIALTDKEIDEIFRSVPDGTPIEIKP